MSSFYSSSSHFPETATEVSLSQTTAAERSSSAPRAPSVQGTPRTQLPVPRMVVGQGLDIDLIREQLENFGRVVLFSQPGCFISERSVQLLTRALKVTRTSKHNIPNHFAIPRHVDRAGELLASLAQWENTNWRTRAGGPHGSHIILLARTALRHLPPEGSLTWTQLEEMLRADRVFGVYEPLASAVVPEGKAARFNQDWLHLGSAKGRSKLLNMAASVFLGSPGVGPSRDAHAPEISDADRTSLQTKLESLGVKREFIVLAPFGDKTLGTFDWSMERCAELARHAHEWCQCATVVLTSSPEQVGKAERLRIIAGPAVCFMLPELTPGEKNALVAQAKGLVVTPGELLQLALKLKKPAVALTGTDPSMLSETTETPALRTPPLLTPVKVGEAADQPYVVVRPGSEGGKVSCAVCLAGDHQCLDDLEAGPVARSLTLILKS